MSESSEVPEVVRTGPPSEVKDKPKPEAEAKPKAVAKSFQPVQEVHHIFRTFSQMGGGVGGSMPGSIVDAQINEYLAVGWRIHSVHHVVNVPEGHTFCWVMIRELS